MNEQSSEEPLEPFRCTGKSIRFGEFELRPEGRELRKHGVPVKIQPKPLLILCALAEHPEELVTRDALRRRLWSEGSFVDFESGLNTAMNRLRAALGDSAERPIYIQTVARVGYRFICPVEVVESGGDSRSKNGPTSRHTDHSFARAQRLQSGLSATQKGLGLRSRSYVVLLLLVAALVWLILGHLKGLVSWSEAHFSIHHKSQSTVQMPTLLKALR